MSRKNSQLIARVLAMLIPYLYTSPNYLAKSGPVTPNHLKHRQDGETQEHLQQLLMSHLDAGQCGDRSEIDPNLGISRLAPVDFCIEQTARLLQRNFAVLG